MIKKRRSVRKYQDRDVEEDKLKRILNLPPGIEPIALTPLGYPAALPESKSRKPWDEVIQYI